MLLKSEASLEGVLTPQRDDTYCITPGRLCCKNGDAMVNSALFREQQRSSLHEQSKPIQMASLRSRYHFALGALVPEIFAQLSRPRENDVGTGIAGGSYNHLSLGAVLCPRTGQALPTTSESHQ